MTFSFLISFTREKSETHMLLLQKRLFNIPWTGVSMDRKAVRSCKGWHWLHFGLFDSLLLPFLVEILWMLSTTFCLSSSFGGLWEGRLFALKSPGSGFGIWVGIGMGGCIFVHEWALAVAHSGAGLWAWAVFGCVTSLQSWDRR